MDATLHFISIPVSKTENRENTGAFLRVYQIIIILLLCIMQFSLFLHISLKMQYQHCCQSLLVLFRPMVPARFQFRRCMHDIMQCNLKFLFVVYTMQGLINSLVVHRISLVHSTQDKCMQYLI